MALKHHASQFGRFWLIGTACMSLYYVVLFTAKSLIGIPVLVAVIIASAVYGLTGFTAHKLFTFRNDRTHDIHLMAVKFVVVVVSVGLANVGLMYLLTTYAPWWYIYSQVIATVLLMVPNYFANHWVFADQKLTVEFVRREKERIEQKPGYTYFNNFHGRFPGGYNRSRTADYVQKYLHGDSRMDQQTIAWVHEDLKLWVVIDTKIVELGYDLEEVRNWTYRGKLESDHLDLMIEVYVHLVNLGYQPQDLTG